MKKFTVLLLTLLMGFSFYAKADDQKVWCAVCDGETPIPLKEVVCVVASDDDTSFNVVLTDSTVGPFSSMKFQESSGVGEILAGSQKFALIEAGRVLKITGCDNGTVIAVSDLSGRMVYRNVSSEDAFSVNIENWMPGCYLVNVDGRTFKFIKK